MRRAFVRFYYPGYCSPVVIKYKGADRILLPIDQLSDEQVLKVYNELCFVKKSIGEWKDKEE